MSYHRSIDGDNDFSRCFFFHFFFFFFFFFFFLYSGPVSVCVLLYGIILIQILINYNVQNLITACSRLHDSDPQNWKISLPWEGDTPPPPPHPPPLARFAPSHLLSKYFLCFSWSQKSSPHFWIPGYATGCFTSFFIFYFIDTVHDY